MSLCNAKMSQLLDAGLSILGHCTVEGCGHPVARHRDDGILLGLASFSCVVLSGKKKITVEVASYEELVDNILESWSIFVFQKFILYVDFAKDEFELKPDLKFLSKDKVNKVIVKNCSKGFSKNITEQAVLKNINGI